MTQITAKAFATEDTEITENSKGFGFRGNHSPACKRGVFLVRKATAPRLYRRGCLFQTYTLTTRRPKPHMSS